jgi:hypothetical protein
MNSAIALFFASLVSGMLSLADFRPAFSDVVQILTGVELDAEENTTTSDDTQQVYRPQPATAKCLKRQSVATKTTQPDCPNLTLNARG